MPRSKIMVVKSVDEELIIKGVTKITRIRAVGIGLVVLVLVAIIFFNLNAQYEWIDFRAF